MSEMAMATHSARLSGPRQFGHAEVRSRIVLATAAICIVVAGLRGIPSFAQAQIATPAKAARHLPPVPQTDFYRTPHPLPPGRAGDLIRSAPVPEYRLRLGVSAFGT